MQTKRLCFFCPHAKVLPDPDPTDWFNDDDEAIVCTKLPSDEKSKFRRGHQMPNKLIEGMLRPYETRKVNSPNWCPLGPEEDNK